MATVGVALTYRGTEGVPVLRSAVRASEAFTSSGTSQPTTMVALADEYWSITASGGAVWVRFAAAPVAAAGDDWLLADGATREWEAVVGDKAAIIDA